MLWVKHELLYPYTPQLSLCQYRTSFEFQMLTIFCCVDYLSNGKATLLQSA